VTRAWLVFSLALGGCSLLTDSYATNDFSGDAYPIAVDTSTGAIIVGMRQDNAPDRTAVIDILSPLSLVDPGPGETARLQSADMLVLGRDGAGMLDLPRAKLSADVLSLHPCDEDMCAVGTAANQRAYDAVIGANALAGDAVRLRLHDDTIFVLADVGGDDHGRSYACDAVFPSPYRGGGTLVIAGTEYTFANRRTTLQVCLGDNPSATLQSQRGADVLLVASTGIGRTILGESAYERYRFAHAADAVPPPPLAQLPADQVFLPSGPIDGKLVTIPTFALVAASSSSPRAPCRQVYASHLLAQRNCDRSTAEECPCDSGDFCAVPAVIELKPPAGLDVLVISDDDPTLQALRTELRPDQPEVDGLLGSDAMRDVELDVDYPHDRVLGRCSDSRCSTRPALPDVADRDQVLGCLAMPPAPITRTTPPAK
jgi:hypothetical protein